MKRLLPRLAVPAFLVLCMLLGGSSQSVWANAVLKLLAVLLLTWAVLSPKTQPVTRASRLLLALAAVGLALILLQLIPLPPAIWTSLPGRDMVESGYRLLGYELPWLPLSIAPHDTLNAAYALLPPLAVVGAIVGLSAYKESWIAVAVLAGALANVLLGAVQVASGGVVSWAYLHEFTNTGAVGLFANRNHMASLLLAAIPFAGALFALGRPSGDRRGRGFAMFAIGAGGFLLILIGLLLNGTLAALALAVPVAALTALILPAGWRLRRLLWPLAVVTLVVAVVAVASSAVRTEIVSAPDLGSLASRGTMWEVTGRAIAETFPAGTGLGTFPGIYALQEDLAAVGITYINHAHNDYLELLLEMGIAGLVLMALFLVWWAWQAVRVWRSPFSSHFAKAATIASAAILAHSAVDYPLRTAAIAAVFAACVAMMAQAPAHRRSDEPKHVRIA